MFRFIVRRLLVVIPLLFASSILTFLLVTNIGTPKKIMDTLGFKPQVTLADGLYEAVEEMRGA